MRTLYVDFLLCSKTIDHFRINDAITLKGANSESDDFYTFVLKVRTINDEKMVDGILESWINVENNENEILEFSQILGDVGSIPY